MDTTLDGERKQAAEDTPEDRSPDTNLTTQSLEELRISEQRLRLALESGQIGTWDLDLATRDYVNISPIWKAQFGRSGADGITMSDFLSWLHPEDRDRVHDVAWDAINNGRDYEAQYRCFWPDGSIHWIRSHGRLLRDASGTPVRMIGATHDITERVEREADAARQLQEAQDRADRDPLTGLWNHRAFHHLLAGESARAERESTALALVMLDLDNFKFFNDAYGHAVGDAVLCRVAECLQSACRPSDVLARFGGDEFVLLLPNIGDTPPAQIEARLRSVLDGLAFTPDGQETAVPITLSLGVSSLPRDGSDRSGAMDAADKRLRRAKTGGEAETEADNFRQAAQADAADFSMLDALVTAVDNKDRYTGRHSVDVMDCCLLLARAMNLPDSERRTLAIAALLHDVGKIGVPDSILRKPSALTDAELATVKQHPTMGAALVGSVAGLEATLDAVRHHHEHWNGSGYPAGLRGEAIPLSARLMAVADAFSAMTTDRPYRKGMAPAVALSLLKAGAGTQWDPACIAAFLQARADPQS